MLDDVLDKEAGSKPKLVAPPAGVASPTSVSPTAGSPVSGSAISAAASAVLAIRHIPQADLDAYINGQLFGPRLDFCRTHLDSCDECRAALEDLRNFKNSHAGRSMGGSLKRELDRRKRQKQLKAAAAAATVVGVVAAVFAAGWFEVVKPRLHVAAVMASGAAAEPAQNVAHGPEAADAQTRAPAAAQAQDTRKAGIQPHATASAALAAQPHGAASATVPAAATVQSSGAQPHATPTAQQRGTAVASGQAIAPAAVAPAAGSAAPATGAAATAVAVAPADSTTFALLGPFGDEISDDRPEFTWQPITGAAKYAVILVDEGLRPISHARVKTTSWRPRKPLRRGRTYLWQVTAILHNGTKVIGTGPTSAEARIHILSPSAAKHSDK